MARHWITSSGQQTVEREREREERYNVFCVPGVGGAEWADEGHGVVGLVGCSGYRMLIVRLKLGEVAVVRSGAGCEGDDSLRVSRLTKYAFNERSPSEELEKGDHRIDPQHMVMR